MIKIEYSLYILLILAFTILYYVLQRDIVIPQKQYLSQVKEELEYRRQVLLRACSVIGDLDTMSKNGTSFEDLIQVHRRVHNLKEKLWKPTKQCFEPIQDTGERFVIYEVFNRKNLTETRYFKNKIHMIILIQVPTLPCHKNVEQRVINVQLGQS